MHYVPVNHGKCFHDDIYFFCQRSVMLNPRLAGHCSRLSKANHTLAIVDPATLKIIARIPVGDDPHEVVASSDGKTAYVCIYGGGSLHEINMIDLVAQKPLGNIDTRPLLWSA